MLEMTLIRMAMLRPLLAIDEIIKKLEEMGKTHPSGKMESREVPALKKLVKQTLQPKEKEGERVHQRGKEEIEKKEVPTEEPFDKPENPEPPSGPVREDSQEGGIPDKGQQERKEEIWSGLVDFVRARSPVLGSFLALGGLIHLSGERNEIGFERDSFHYERMMERENRSQLEQFCRDFLKKEMKVIISSFEEETRPMGKTASKIRETALVGEKGTSGKGMNGDSLIQEALRLFDGKIVKG
jgi:hypothetical protein